MATINFSLRSQADKNVSIYIHLSVGRGKNGNHKKFRTPTGFTIHPDNWKDNSGQFGFPKNSKLSEMKNLKSALRKLSSFIDKAVNSANENGEIIGTTWLKEKIKECFNRLQDDDQEKQSNLVTDYVQNIIDNADTKILPGGKIGLSPNRVKGYVTFKGIVEKYEKHTKKKLLFKDINVKFEDDFRTWLLKTKGYSKNYAGKNFDNLKAVCADAERKGIEINDYAIKIRSFSEDKDERNIVTLSFDELEAIEKVELSSEALINARKWLLLGCEIGQRGGDLLNVTESNFNVRDGLEYVDIKQQKTGKSVSVGVGTKIAKIKKSGLPHKISIQKFNDYLKDLCEVAEIDQQTKGKLYDSKLKRKVPGVHPKHKLITSHTCRRSFATNYYIQMPTPILMAITGHSKESLFLTYIGKPVDKDANAKLMLQYARIMEQNRKEKKAKEKAERKAKMKVIKKAN